MQEPDASSKIFHGIRFVLHGFDSETNAKVRSTLIHGGAVDSMQWDQNYSHLIVDNVEYEDPLCVEARTTGKILVTALWVNHCVEVGLAVDPNSVIYRPPRNLNGIPGTQSFIMCLTGYQRQDRDDIMTMVRLMGAQFSKPLVANKVTHLICYKFEGEKYELARRLKRISLVNHRWLEDCLKEWTILPEENYRRSGHELEIEEAEAKDSDEDAETNVCPQKTFDCFKNPVNQTKNSVDKEEMKAETEPVSVSPGDQTKSSVNSVSVQLHDQQELSPESMKVANGPKDILETVAQPSEFVASPMLMTSSYIRKTPLRSSKHIFSGGASNLVTFPDSSLGDATEYGNGFQVRSDLVSNCDQPLQKLQGNKLPSADASIETINSKEPSLSLSSEKKKPQYPTASKEKEPSAQPSQAGLDLGQSAVDPNCGLSSSSRLSDVLKMYEGQIGNEDLVDLSKDSDAAAVVETDNDHLRMTISQEVEVPAESELLDHNQSSTISSLAKTPTGQITSITSANLNQSQSSSANVAQKTQVKKETAKTDVSSKRRMYKAANQKGSIHFGKARGNNETSVTLNDGVSNSGTHGISLENIEVPRITVLKYDVSLDGIGQDVKKMEPQLAVQRKKKRKVLVEKNPELVAETVKKRGKKSQVVDKARAVEDENLELDVHRNLGNETSIWDSESMNKLNEAEKKASDVPAVSTIENNEKTIAEKKSGDITSTKGKNKTKRRKVNSPEQSENIPLADEVIPVMPGEIFDNRELESPKIVVSERSKQRLTEKNDVAIACNGPMCFIFSGNRVQRKEFQAIVKHLRGKCCRDCHQWSYQATHYVATDPLRRTEKLFAAVASGRWVLKMEYLTACKEAGRFLPEEQYEWHKEGMSEDGAISLEAPRKWRLLKCRTGHGAFRGMRIVIYGECIAPSLDTLKRVVKAGDGTILATSPPYTRLLKSGVDYAIISPGISKEDLWVQEFLKNDIPCVLADYLVDYVCKPGHPLESHVLFGSNPLAEKSFFALRKIAEEVIQS